MSKNGIKSRRTAPLNAHGTYYSPHPLKRDQTSRAGVKTLLEYEQQALGRAHHYVLLPTLYIL
jgi:hypothetical protein